MARRKEKTTTKNGVTYYYETVEFPRKPNGKRDIKYAYGKTVAEMKEKLKQLELKRDQGIITSNNDYFGSMFKDWFYNTHIKGKKISTINRYEGLYKRYIQDCILKNIKISKIKALDIQKFYNLLESEGRTPNTIKMIHKVMKPFLNYLYVNGFTIKDLGVKGIIKLPKIIKKEKSFTVLTLEDQQKFINSLDGSPDRLLYLFALGTGLRLGELLAITWDDIKNGMVTVNKNVKKVSIDGKWVNLPQDTPKTENSNREVPIPIDLIKELKGHKLQQNNIKARIGEMYSDNNLVFCTDYGTYIDPSNLNKRFKRALNRANVTPIKFHSMRHTYATRLFENNVPPKVVSDLLGHADITTTLNIYTWVMKSEKTKAVDTINNIFTVAK